MPVPRRHRDHRGRTPADKLRDDGNGNPSLDHARHRSMPQIVKAANQRNDADPSWGRPLTYAAAGGK
jgi:hypothetical protein